MALKNSSSALAELREVNETSSDTDYHRERLDFKRRAFEDPTMLPHRYVLVLTNLCNLRCSFCFQEKKKLKDALNTDEWISLIDQLPSYAWVTLTGGEPFMFKGFNEVFRRVTEKHGCNVISNGLMLDESKIDLLLSEKKFKVLSISVDDIGNTIRDVKPERWRYAESMMREFVKRRNERGAQTILDTKTVVLDDNAEQLFDIHRYCMETLQCDTHSFQFLKGSPIQHADFMFPMEAMFKETDAYVYEKFVIIQAQLERVRQYNLETGRKCFLHPKIADLNGSIPITDLDLSFLNRAKHEKSSFCQCKAPWESVHVNADGNLFPCMAIRMGNVRETPLKEIISGIAFREFKDTIRKEGTVPGCNRCGYLLPKEGSA
jgi:radical SAM protein with 4Fe4S-binding SPASM domain